MRRYWRPYGHLLSLGVSVKNGVAENIGLGVLFSALAGFVAFSIGFGFWFGIYWVERLVSG